MDNQLEKFGKDRVFCWDDHVPEGSIRSEITVEEIFHTYYPWWKYKVLSAYPDSKEISFARCVEDFCVVHFAWEKKTSL